VFTTNQVGVRLGDAHVRLGPEVSIDEWNLRIVTSENAALP